MCSSHVWVISHRQPVVSYPEFRGRCGQDRVFISRAFKKKVLLWCKLDFDCVLFTRLGFFFFFSFFFFCGLVTGVLPRVPGTTWLEMVFIFWGFKQKLTWAFLVIDSCLLKHMIQFGTSLDTIAARKSWASSFCFGAECQTLMLAFYFYCFAPDRKFEMLHYI